MLRHKRNAMIKKHTYSHTQRKEVTVRLMTHLFFFCVLVWSGAVFVSVAPSNKLQSTDSPSAETSKTTRP